MPNWDDGEGPYQSDFPFTNSEGNKKRRSWRQPVKTYNVVRRHEKANGEVLWFPVGTIAFWEDGSAKLNLNMFPQPFHVFPKEE